MSIQSAELEEGESPQDWKPTSRERLIMTTLSVLSLMVSLDASVIVTSLSAVVSDLNTSTSQGFWVGTSYLLANAIAMPSISALSDIFGRPWCLLSSLGFFALGTILCCLARTIAILLVGRCLQGVGGGGIMILSLVVFTDIVPLRFRPRWYGMVLGAWALGNCAGPLIGGAIAEHATWPWIFYIMFPFCMAGFVLIPLTVGLKAKNATVTEKLGRVDWFGGLFFTASAILFLVAVSWGGGQYPWHSPATLVPLCLGVSGLAWTVFYEFRLATVPLLHFELFRDLSSWSAYLCGMLQGLVIYGQLYYIPFYFLSVKGVQPLQTGLALLPVTLTLVPASIATGILVTRSRNYTHAIRVGWAVTCIASGLTLLWDDKTSRPLWVTTLILLGFGHGSVLNAQNFATQALCNAGEEGAAAAMYGFLRQFGMALGVGIGTTAFQNTMALKLGWEGLPREIAEQSEGSISKLHDLAGDSAFKRKALNGYIYGFHGVYAVFTATAGLAFLLSLFVKQVGMDRAIRTEHRLHDRRTRVPEARDSVIKST